MSKNNTKTNTNTEAAVETDFNSIDISKLDNKGVLDLIKKLTAERKVKRDACEKAVEQLWSDYKKWREENYRPIREKLLAQLGNNHDARVAKREERKAEALEKARLRKEKADAKLAKLEAGEKSAESAEAPAVEA